MRCPRCDHNLPDGDRFCGRCGLARTTDGKAVDPLLGIVVDGRYRIEERVGVGGMGTVYRGTHVELGQKVAVKVLHQRHVANPDLVERFRIEARTYARVDHPNVVKLLHADAMADGTAYMVMEYCPGTSLAQRLRAEGRLPPRLAGDVAMQIAQGLSATHAAGIVHRDLKPENIVLTQTRRGRYHVKLLDFGIAKDLEDEGPRLTQHGMVFGTPEYMAPEQARGQAVDERSDLYALGCVMYEMLCGRPPFTGADKLRVMHQQASDPPQPLAERLGPGEVPAALERAIDRCLAKRIGDRYPNADALIGVLEAFVEGDHPAEPAPPSTAERAQAPRPSPTPTAVGTPVPTRGSRTTPGTGLSADTSLEARPGPGTGSQAGAGTGSQAKAGTGSQAGPGTGPRPTPDRGTRTARRTPVGAVALDLDPPDEHTPLPGTLTPAGTLTGLSSFNTLIGDDEPLGRRERPREPGGTPFAVVVLSFLALAGGAVFLFGRDAPTRSAGFATVHLTTHSAPDATVGSGPSMPPELSPPRPRRRRDAGTASAASPQSGLAATAPSTAASSPATEPARAPATASPRGPTSEPPRASATRAPATQAPRAPATQAPRAPATQAPRAPATQPPRAPATQPPRAPATQPPRAPATQAPARPSAEAQVTEARRLLGVGNLDAAVGAVEQALAGDPEHGGARELERTLRQIRSDLSIAKSAFASGDCTDALKTVQAVLKKAPRLAEAQRIVDGCQAALPPREM